jgi:ATP-dependent Clp protease protease subunit
MSKRKMFYALNQSDDNAELHIFGDVTSWPWLESDVSATMLSNKLKEVTASHIDVWINSMGGEVAEGLAIYNALRNHSASVTTHCEGFACSIASVIFMAGDERVMEHASLLMVHHPWTMAAGNADDMRKTADDLDSIEQAIKAAYRRGVNLEDDELNQLLDGETWIGPEDATAWGFATSINEDIDEPDGIAASAARKVIDLMRKGAAYRKRPEALTKADIKDVVNAALFNFLKVDGEPEKPPEPKLTQPTENKLIELLSKL